ncbi:MAG: fatty acid desaturase [Gammaproteobacteria bacterium]|nr:fatty acid desaturase [Gammaproteobacteria bacterium]
MAHNTIKQEIEVGRRFSPVVAVPTLLLLAGVYLGLGLSTWLGLEDYIPLWLAGLANGIILYATYTVVHEGVHDNIVSRKSSFRWFNMTAAFLAALPLWLLIYPHRSSHIVHHRKCNSEADPDIYARGSFGVVALWRIPLAILGQFNPFEQYRLCAEHGLSPWQRYFSYASFALFVAIVISICALGYAYELLVLWLIPFFIGYGVMLVLFTWVPHHPHSILGRYHDTRCSLWPGGNLLTQGQNYHLIHHMMPWVPWYRYERVFEEIRPLLEQQRAIIDGFWPRPARESIEYTSHLPAGQDDNKAASGA